MSLTEQLKILIDGQASGAVKAFAETGSASEALQAKTTLTGQAMQRLGLQGVESGTLIKTALVGGAIAGGVAIAKFAIDGVEAFSNLTGQVRAFQRVSGASAEDSSRLTFAVKELGIQPDAAASAFGRLATRLGTGKADLEQYGIKTQDASGKNRDLAAIVADVSDKYQQAGSAQAKAAIGNEAFGRSWQTLAPLLGKGADSLKQIYDQAGKDHQIFSQADLERGREFALATKQLSDAFTGLKVELAQALIPTFTQATTGITSSIQAADSATSAIGGLGGAVSIVAGNINPLSLGMHGVSAATDLASGSFLDAGKNALESIPGVGGFASAIFGGEEATNKFTDAQNRQKTAMLTAADLLTQGKQHTKEYKDAVAEAKSSTDEMSGAQQKLATSLETSTQKTYEAAQADLTFGAGKLNTETAVANVGKQLDQYNQTLYSNQFSTDGATAAAGRLDDAHRGLVGSVLAAVAAAGKQAADNEGPNASAADKMKASTDAQRFTLAALENQFPGLRDQVSAYVGDLHGVPSDVTTTIHHNIQSVLGDIGVLNSALGSIPSDVHVTIHHDIVGL